MAISLKHKMSLFVISLAMFMESVDTTIINTAIPAMSLSFHLPPIDCKIALISYLVSLAIFIPVSGWIADRFGIKRVFLFAISIFLFSSVLCGYTSTLYELVLFRTLQGLGGSLMLPVGRLIILRTFERHQIIDMQSRMVMIGALGMLLGPPLGGMITDYLSWSWIFWVNIPIGFCALYIGCKWLDDTPPSSIHRLDKTGFFLFGGGLAGLTFGFSALSESAITLTTGLGLMMSSLAILAYYFFHSRKILNTIIQTSLFGYRTFRISIAGNFFCRLGFGSVPFLLPLLLQISLGYTAKGAGLLVAPTAIGILMAKPFVFRMLRMLGYKKLLLINTACVCLALWSMMLIDADTSIYTIATLSCLFGFLNSIQFTGMNSLTYADLPENVLSSATSILSTTQQVSQSFGVAIGALLIQLFSKFSSNLTLSPVVFHQTFLILGVLTLISSCIFANLKSHDGHQMLK